MTEHASAAPDWATRRCRRWSAPRLLAALALHLLVLVALVVGTGRVRLPPRGAERTTTLVEVMLAARRPPPPVLPLPVAPPSPRIDAGMAAAATPARSTARRTPAAPPSPGPIAEPVDVPITPSSSDSPTVASAARPPASAPSAPRVDLLTTAATRAAIRDAGRATRLSELGDAATHLDAGSELVAADGSRCGTCTRGLAPSKRASERLAQGVAAAVRPDCMTLSSSAGLLALPVLAYAEATGKCGH